MGGRMTVFPRAALASLRGVGRDADVVLEVVNGIAFFTPLWWWMRAPRVTLVHHVHQDHYVAEMGKRGRLAALLAERLPLRDALPPPPVPDDLATPPGATWWPWASRPSGSTSPTSASRPTRSSRRGATRRRRCSTSGG